MADGGESIFRLIPQEEGVPAKPPLFISEHSRPSGPPGSKAFGSFGRSVRESVHPQAYTKKGDVLAPTYPGQGQGERLLLSPARRGSARRGCLLLLCAPLCCADSRFSSPAAAACAATRGFKYPQSKVPQLPSRADVPITGLTTSKNYVTANAVENILQAPRPVKNEEWTVADAPNFGKVPEYLTRIKQERVEEEEFIRTIQQTREEDTGFKVLPEEQRLQILAGLKAKWMAVNKQYMQDLSICIDSDPKKRQKEDLESALDQIEKDIESMSKPNVVIAVGV